MINPKEIHSVTISLASPAQILDWSSGEVTASALGVQNTKKSIYSEVIFGRDNTPISRERLGHIKLQAPAVHPFYVDTLATLLGISDRSLQAIIYYQLYLYVDENDNGIPNISLLKPEEYLAQKRTGIILGTGAAVIQQVLDKYYSLDQLEPLMIKLTSLQTDKTEEGKALDNRISTFKKLLEAKQAPSAMLITNLPVLPLSFRLNQTYNNRNEVDPLNQLYTNILVTNKEIQDLIKNEACEAFLNIERCKLQRYVDALLSNNKNNSIIQNIKNYKSLVEKLKGKTGLFRNNLLGKRVNYSARSVIMVGPTLKFNECGLPILIALELFRPFLVHRLCTVLGPKKKLLAKSLQEAEKQIDTAIEYINNDNNSFDIDKLYNNCSSSFPGETWEVLKQLKTLCDPQGDSKLAEAEDRYCILLNRAPSLHRLNIQAFYPKLTNDNAIHLHPLVCAGFNADFDGDAMSIHLPLSKAAQEEAKKHMLSHLNILSPCTGEPLALPSQDMVLGLYYQTYVENNEPVEFTSISAVESAYKKRKITTHTRVKVCLNIDEITSLKLPNPQKCYWVYTSWGNIEFFIQNPEIPKSCRPFYQDENNDIHLDRPLDKKLLKKIINKAYNMHTPQKTAEFINYLKDFGFTEATEVGLSIAAPDIPQASNKQALLSKDYLKANESLEEHWENFNQSIYNEIKIARKENLENPANLIAESGARGNDEQWQQLSALRGLMKDTQGQVIPIPIKSNFVEGMSSFEFFISCHGTRKGLTDTALNTAKSGYLTRRLLLLAQDVNITQRDCAPKGNIPYIKLNKDDFSHYSNEAELKFAKSLSGRILAQDLGEYKANHFITHKDAKLLAKQYASIPIRTAITCQCKTGICQKCYGRNIATRRLVELNTPVGILAAQSLGEPTTQFTLRTFHSGNTSSATDITEAIPYLEGIFTGSIVPYSLKNILEEDTVEHPHPKKHEFAEKLLQELLKVYNANKVDIKRIHLEIIIHQLLINFAEEDKPTMQKIEARILEDKAFLAAAGFQNTTSVLAQAALYRETDTLENLNSRILLGKL